MNDDCSDARMPNIYQFNVDLQRRHNGETIKGLDSVRSDVSGVGFHGSCNCFSLSRFSRECHRGVPMTPLER